MAADLNVRLARDADASLLAVFECSGADARVEPFVRTMALDRHRRTRSTDDVRLLLFFDETDSLVGVTLHQRNQRVVSKDTYDIVPGTELVVIAIGDRFRDGRTEDGEPFVAAMVEKTFEDIRSRDRGNLVSMLVQPSNEDGYAIVQRLKATLDGTDEGDDVFCVFLD